MSEVAAMEKARSLAAFAKTQGSPLREWVLLLTDEEALALLDPLAAGELGRFANQDELAADCEDAKRRRDPWPLLANFELCGLEIGRAKESLH